MHPRLGITALLLALAACAAAPAHAPGAGYAPAPAFAQPETVPRVQYLATGQPSAAALQVAADAGYVAVIDLRTAGEDRGYDEAAAAAAAGLRYVSLPVAGPRDVTFERAAELDAILAEIDGPVLLHCASGNRVGALFALRASAAGASAEEALAAGREAGLTQLAPVVEKRLAEK